MAASGAKYGIATAHFYWVGAIPAMVFLAVFMMPFYYGSKARSVPEYLKLRFDERTRALNSITFAVMTVFASGISMNALAKLLNQLLGWNYHVALWVCSVVVLLYVLRGGLTSAIYTEVLQFFMIVLGFAPVVWLALKDVGGWGQMNETLATVATNPSSIGAQREDVRARRVVERLEAPPRRPRGEPDGRRPLRDGVRPRLRALVRVLVHELPGRPARHGRQEHERGPAHAAHRRRAQDADPRPRDPARACWPSSLASLRARTATGFPRSPSRATRGIVSVVKATAAENLDAQAAFAKVSAAVGMKLDEAKVASLLQDVPTLDDDALETRIQDSVVRGRLRRRHPVARQEVLPLRASSASPSPRSSRRSCRAWPAT